MNAEQFCIWLKGFVEISNSWPTEEEWVIIVERLMKIEESKITPINFAYNKAPEII